MHKAREAPKEKVKTSLELKIEAREKREAEEAQRKQELADDLLGNEAEGLSGAAAEKLRLKKLEEASDMAGAMDAFGVDFSAAKKAVKKAPPKKEAPAAPAPVDMSVLLARERGFGCSFLDAPLKTDKDIEELTRMVQAKLSTLEVRRMGWVCRVMLH